MAARPGRTAAERSVQHRPPPAGRLAVPGNYSLEITPLSSGGQTVMAAEIRRRAERRRKRESAAVCLPPCRPRKHVRRRRRRRRGGSPLPRHRGLLVTSTAARATLWLGVVVPSRPRTPRTANNPPFLPVRPRAELPVVPSARTRRSPIYRWVEPTDGW